MTEPADDWSDLNSVTDVDTGADLVPGGKAVCPKCGKTLSVTQAGELRQHKCIDGESSTETGSKRKGRTPASVRKLGTALAASGVESGSAWYVSRIVPCERDEVPAEIKDPEVIFDPLIDLLWPSLPKGAQKAIKRIADESDLIAAALALTDYFRELNTWAKQEKIRRGLDRTIDVPTERTEAVPDEPSIAETFPAGLGTVTPFRPAAP